MQSPTLPGFIAAAPTLADSLAQAYLNSPATVPTDSDLTMFRMWIRREFNSIPVHVVFQGEDINLPDTVDRLNSEGALFISTANNIHPFLSPMENAMFRAVHDWHHIVSGADSTLNGEIKSFMYAADRAPREIRWMLLSEIVLQAAVCVSAGYFPEQKLVKLEGF